MGEIRTVTTLKRKRAEIAASIKAAFIKHKLKEGEVTYAELAKRLKKHGYKAETEASVTLRLKRGSFPATWFLAVLAAQELDGVALEEI
jgi:hypothetical protein